MPYGFVIDQRKCIGCHACTVACKSENHVPLGSFRTWVKYVDKGTYPSVRRHFTVLRCNHCDDAPCVEICPVSALGKREDGIVDLDRDKCIGCQACLQACPYDALYLNPHTGTAEKCHYCAHRTEVGLEPACVTVCPEQAIVSGDADDPETPIGRLIANEKTSQRKVEKGTKPRVWYLDALPEALEPGATREPSMYLWSDRSAPVAPVPQGMEAPQDLITSLNAPHAPAWGWHIWAYLLTKNVAAGAMLFAPLLAFFGIATPGESLFGVLPEIVALAFLGITSFLLVHDLGRPERFWRILLAPNTKSWLVKGAWVLTGFGLLVTVSAVARLLGEVGLSDTLRWVNLPLAVLASGYTAFLFHQCRGRDLWLENDLFAHLIAQAALCGAALAVVMAPESWVGWAVLAGLAALNAEWIRIPRMPGHAPADAVKARTILSDTGDDTRAAAILFASALLGVLFAALGGMGGALGLLAALAAVGLAGAGMYIWERAWVRAGQEVPNS